MDRTLSFDTWLACLPSFHEMLSSIGCYLHWSLSNIFSTNLLCLAAIVSAISLCPLVYPMLTTAGWRGPNEAQLKPIWPDFNQLQKSICQTKFEPFLMLILLTIGWDGYCVTCLASQNSNFVRNFDSFVLFHNSSHWLLGWKGPILLKLICKQISVKIVWKSITKMKPSTSCNCKWFNKNECCE